MQSSRPAYRQPVVELMEVAPEQGMAQSFGEAGAAGGGLVTDDTELNW